MENLLSLQDITELVQETANIITPLKDQKTGDSIKGRLEDIDSILNELKSISESNTISNIDKSISSQGTSMSDEKSALENSDATFFSEGSKQLNQESTTNDMGNAQHTMKEAENIPSYCPEEKYTTLPDYYKKAFTFEEFNSLIHKIKIKQEFSVDGLSRETFVNTTGEKGESLLGAVIHLDLICGVYTKEGIKYKLQSK